MRDSPKVIMECAFRKNHVVEPFLFEDCVINTDNYLDILQNYFISQLELLNLKHNAVLQQDGASWHFALHVREFLNQVFLNKTEFMLFLCC